MTCPMDKSNGQISGGFPTIVADPPWPFHWGGSAGGKRSNATSLGYETMTVDAICELGADALLEAWPDHGTLFLWTPHTALHSGEAQCVAGAWGYKVRVGEIIWRKPNFGTGAFPRIGHETCAIYRRGKGSLKPDAPRDFHSVQTWSQPHGRGNQGKVHSAKPDGFFDAVVVAHRGPYLSLFERRARLGWETWGDEALHGTELVA